MLLLITVLLSLLTPEVQGVMCYICSNVENPEDCTTVGECPAHQKCHIKRYASTLGIDSYDLSCQPDSFCSGVNRRSDSTRRQADMIMWNKCCDTDFCNVDYVKNGTLLKHGGLRCFDCDNARDPADCTNVIECELGDVCATYEVLSVKGDSSYRLTCESKDVCTREGYFLPLGRRNVKRRDLCRGCCEESSHCNRQYCSKLLNNSNPHPIGTTPAPTSTPRPRVAIVRGPKDQKVELGKSAVLDCGVSAYPEATITWEHIHYGVDTPVTHHIVTTLTGSRIIIPQVQNKDAGTYICIATNSAGSTFSQASLDIGIAPVISLQPTTKIVKIGDTINLPCQAKGDPKPTVSWDFHSGTDDHRYPNGIEVTADHSLVIPSIMKQHLGVWTCVAQNEYGTRQVNVTVKEG